LNKLILFSFSLTLSLSLFLAFAIVSAALLGARFRNDTTLGSADDGMEGNGPLDIPAGCNMGRRRSRAVLYQLSGHYVSKRAVAERFNYFIWPFSYLFLACSPAGLLTYLLLLAAAETGKNQD